MDEHDCEGVLFTVNLSMTYLGHTFDLEGVSVQVTLHSTLDEGSGEIPHDGGSGYTGTYGNFAYESDLDYPLLNWSIYAVFEIRAAGRTFEVSPVAGGSNILIGQPYTLRLTYGDYPGPGHRVSLDLNVNADYRTPDMFTKSLLACHWLRLAEKVALEEFSMPDNGESYFEVNFHEKTYEHLEISLSLWSEREYLNPSESVAVIECSMERNLGEDDWELGYDLLEGDGMQTDRYAPGTYVLEVDYRSFRVRVESRPFGTDNKGRVSISNVVIS